MNKMALMQVEVLVFRDGSHNLALPLGQIKEIVNLRRLISMPFAAPFLLGLVNVHGKIIPVLSAHRLIDPKSRVKHDMEYAAVVESAGMQVAIACQRIDGVKSVPAVQDVGDDELMPLMTIDGKRLRLLMLPAFIQHTSDHLMRSNYKVQP